MPEKKAKNKTNLQQCISRQFTLQQIMHLQNDTKVLETIFPTAKNEKAKNAWKGQKTKETRNSAFHYILPFHKLCL